MNSGTRVGALIVAAALVVLIALVIQLTMRGWQRRVKRQAELIGTLPGLPDEVGTPNLCTRGTYVGSALSPAWNDRISVGDLDYRCDAVLTRYPEGILMVRAGAQPIWIPRSSISMIRLAARKERSIAGKVSSRSGVLAIRWRLPSGVQIDTGFRADDRDEYEKWIQPRSEGAA